MLDALRGRHWYAARNIARSAGVLPRLEETRVRGEAFAMFAQSDAREHFPRPFKQIALTVEQTEQHIALEGVLCSRFYVPRSGELT